MPQSIAQFDAAAHFNEDLAAKYDRRIRTFCPSYDALHRMLAPCLDGLPEHTSFLSVGAGTGAELLTLGKRFPSWRFVAVDPEKRNPNISVRSRRICDPVDYSSSQIFSVTGARQNLRACFRLG